MSDPYLELLFAGEITPKAYEQLTGKPAPSLEKSAAAGVEETLPLPGANHQGEKSVRIDGDNTGDIHTGDTIINAPDPAAAAKRIYLETLKKECNRLPLAVIGDESAEEEMVRLDQVYIGLDTETLVPMTEAEIEALSDRDRRQLQRGGDRPDQVIKRPLSAFEAIQQEARVVLLGKPGSGKSSFVRYLAADSAFHCLDQPELTGTAHPTPLFLTLRDLAPRLAEITLSDPITDDERQALRNAIIDQWQADMHQLGGGVYADQKLLGDVAEGNILLIFDGLDEVPSESRRAVWQALDALLGLYTEVKRVIVTCRTRSYEAREGLTHFESHTLAPFDEEKIDRFIQGWYTARSGTAGDARVRDLQAAAKAPDLIELARSPLLLTTMAIIHQRDTTLPQERVRLFDEAVKILLHRWQSGKTLSLSTPLKELLRSDRKVLDLLEDLAFQLHEKQSRKAGARLEYGELKFRLENDPRLGTVQLAQDFLDYVDQRAGLLVGLGGDKSNPNHLPQYDFPHRTFQEYLAGCVLFRGISGSVLRQLKERAAESDYWRVPVQYAIEAYRYNYPGTQLLADVAAGLLEKKFKSERTALWSGYILDVLGVESLRAEQEEIGRDSDEYFTKLQNRFREMIEKGTESLTISERAEVGRLINLVEDPRPGVGLKDGLPDVVWGGEVPAGEYEIGSGQEINSRPRLIEIDAPFQLGIYPVTNTQFQAFVDAEDVDNPRWWAEMPNDEIGRSQIRAPRFPFGNHPRSMVSWYQAVAFCRWLNHKLTEQGVDYRVSLPHEHEWEVAARYAGAGQTDGRDYPWGSEFDPGKANTWDGERVGQTGQTTAVGLYPAGKQVELGLYDLSGNVHEWCANQYRDPSQWAVDQSGQLRAQRGGSWDDVSGGARASYRGNGHPYSRNDWVGFRLVRRQG